MKYDMGLSMMILNTGFDTSTFEDFNEDLFLPNPAVVRSAA